jgi:hypothetical protein
MIALAMEAENPGSTEGMTTSEIADNLAAEAEKKVGMRSENHEDCLGILADRIIMTKMGNDRAGHLISDATLIEPTYSATNHERLAGAAARRRVEVKTPEDIYSAHSNSNFRRSLGRVASAATLFTNNLKAKGFLAVHDTGHAFNVHAANETETPYYVATREPVLVFASVAESVYGVDQELVIQASGFYQAAAHKAIEQAKGISLPIARVGIAI